MVATPNQSQFEEANGKTLSMAQAISKARLAITAITPAPVDAIRSCTQGADGAWTATVEVIESVARMGDNDLISAYELTFDHAGELLGFQRVGRYHREDLTHI